MEFKEWLAELAKALVIKLVADGVGRAMEKAAKPDTEKQAKHLR